MRSSRFLAIIFSPSQFDLGGTEKGRSVAHYSKQQSSFSLFYSLKKAGILPPYSGEGVCFF